MTKRTANPAAEAGRFAWPDAPIDLPGLDLDRTALDAELPATWGWPALDLFSDLEKPTKGTRAQLYDGYKPICGAKTRTGAPCRCKLLLNGLRCRFHGGKSTGPRTPDGKRRIAEANRRRWETYREARDDTA